MKKRSKRAAAASPTGPRPPRRGPAPRKAPPSVDNEPEEKASQAEPTKVEERKKKKPVKKSKPKKKANWTLRIFFFLLTLMLFPAAAAVIGYYHFTQDLPSINSLMTYRPKTVSYVYADDGRVIGEFSIEHRVVVPLEQIPRHVILAFVAAEDANFFNHPGLDFIGILRAFIANLKAGRIVQGGSTITQQVTRSFLLTNEKTFTRKIREALLAYRIEQNLTKQEILYLYLNQIYLGEGAYGVESAARMFFDKHVSELTLAEAAVIAGMVKAPSRYSPSADPQKAKERQTYVLNRMMEAEFITLNQAVDALNEEIVYRERPKTFWWLAPYYTEHVRRTLESMYGPDRLYMDGLRVYTAVNVELQDAARDAVQWGLEQLGQRQGYRGPIKHLKEEDITQFLANGPNVDPPNVGDEDKAVITAVDSSAQKLEIKIGLRAPGVIRYDDYKWATRGRHPDSVFKVGDVIEAKFQGQDEESGEWLYYLVPYPDAQSSLVCMENDTGEVKAMVGGRSFWESQFNRAVQARRQPGSSFKPFVYTAAIDSGYTQASNINDVVTEYQDGDKIWIPKNYGRSYGGPTTLYSGLIRSVNVVAVRLLERVGVQKVIEYARRMGIKSPLGANLSLALGTSEVTLLEMVAAFTTFPNLGERVEPMFIRRIEDRDGRIITEFGPQRIRAVNEDTAYIVLDMLRGVVMRGTGRVVSALGRPTGGKTGTTQDHADAWFIGFTTYYTAGVWVGRDRRVSMGPGEQGARTAAPSFLRFMKVAHKDLPVNDFRRPPGVTKGSYSAGFREVDGEMEEYYASFCFKKGEEGPGPLSEGMPAPVEEPSSDRKLAASPLKELWDIFKKAKPN